MSSNNNHEVTGSIDPGQTLSFETTGEWIDSNFDPAGTITVTVDGVNRPDLEYNHTLKIVGGGSSVNYSFTVSDELEGASNLESSDTISGSTATGTISSGFTDTYYFNGSVTTFTRDGSLSVYIDNEQVNPDSFGSTGSDSLLGFTFANVRDARVDDNIVPGDELGTYLESIPEDTLVYIDGGKYPLTSQITISNNIGIAAQTNADTSEEKVILKAQQGLGGSGIVVSDTQKFAMQSVHYNVRALETWTELVVRSDNWHVDDLRQIGRADPDASASGPMMSPSVTDANGAGTLSNISVEEGYNFEKGRFVGQPNSGDGAKDDYTRQGILISRDRPHRGTLFVENCLFEEFSSHAIYVSAIDEGDIVVDECIFKNCDNTSGVRYHGGGNRSVVRNCRTIIDPGNASFDADLYRSIKAHWSEVKSNVTESSGAILENCEVYAANHPRVADLLQARSDGPDWTIRDVTVDCSANVNIVEADDPTTLYGGSDGVITVENCAFRGNYSDPVVVTNRPGSTVSDTCYESGSITGTVTESNNTSSSSCTSVTTLPGTLGPGDYVSELQWRVEATDITEYNSLLDTQDSISSDGTVATGDIGDINDVDAMEANAADSITIYANRPAELEATIDGNSVQVLELGATGDEPSPNESLLIISGIAGTNWRVEATNIKQYNDSLETSTTDTITGDQSVATGTINSNSDTDTMIVSSNASTTVYSDAPGDMSAQLAGVSLSIYELDPSAPGPTASDPFTVDQDTNEPILPAYRRIQSQN